MVVELLLNGLDVYQALRYSKCTRRKRYSKLCFSGSVREKQSLLRNSCNYFMGDPRAVSSIQVPNRRFAPRTKTSLRRLDVGNLT